MDGFTAGPATPPTPSRLGLPEIWLPLWLQLQLQLPHAPPPRSPLNTRPVILRLSRRPRGH